MAELRHILSDPGDARPNIGLSPDIQPTEGSLTSRKLFVGQVPKNFNETMLCEYFSPFGEIDELVILRHHESGAHRRCAFVRYANANSAAEASKALHNKLILPNSTKPLQVRLREMTPLVSPVSVRRLLVEQLPYFFTESDVRELFSAFKPISEIFMVNDLTGSPTGCASIKLSSDEMNEAAIANLNGVCISYGDDSESCNIIVRFPDLHSPIKPQSANKNPSNTIRSFDLSSYDQLPEPFYPASKPTSPQLSPVSPIFSQFQNELLVSPVNSAATSSSSSSSCHQLTGPVGANLFVYHLPAFVRDSELRTLFHTFGEIVSCRVVVDLSTHKSKGFGFVSFSNTDNANIAILRMNGYEIDGKRLKVEHKREHGSNNDVSQFQPAYSSSP